MPSPFPGMDPYLENPEIFPDLHDTFNTYLREHLQSHLPEPYFASIGRRVWVEVSNRYIQPDEDVLLPKWNLRLWREGGGGVAVAPAPSGRGVLVHVPHDDRLEPFVDIYAGRGENKRLVTTIETLSLANKTQGEHGRELYLRKQREMLRSSVHLIEIDLLRAGDHTTAVPLEWASPTIGPFDYHVCVHRFDVLEDFVVYPIRLEDRLPEIEVPLLPGDPVVIIDLQSVFDRCYDTGPYSREIDYHEAVPLPPLTMAQAEWVQRILAAGPPA